MSSYEATTGESAAWQAADSAPTLVAAIGEQRAAGRLVGSRAVGWRFYRQQWWTSIPLAASDVVALTAAVAVFQLFASLFSLPVAPLGPRWAVGYSAGTILAFCLLRLYPACGRSAVREAREICIAATLVWSIWIVSLLTSMPNRWPLIASTTGVWLASIILLPLCRTVAREFCSRLAWWTQPVVVVGTGSHAITNFRKLDRQRRSGLRPVGIVAPPHEYWASINGAPASTYPDLLGPPEDIHQIADRTSAYRVLLAAEDIAPAARSHWYDNLCGSFPVVWVSGSTEPMASQLLMACEVGSEPCLEVEQRLLMPFRRLAKRSLDVGLIVMLSPLLLPLVAGVALMIRWTSRGPAFYRHERIGYAGRRFRAWKFCTMVADAEAVLDRYLRENPELLEQWERKHKLLDDPRVTRVGMILRKTSLDELPQLLNVLLGDMSLVGPRPIVAEELEKYGDRIQLYCRLRPGLTGLWQVSGRNNTTYQQRIAFDSYYARNWSLWLDLSILARTLAVLYTREGAY